MTAPPMTAPPLTLPLKLLRSAVSGRRPGDGTFRALTDGEWFYNSRDRVVCYLDAQGRTVEMPFDPGWFAPLASPAFTGQPSAPTPKGGDSSTRLATTAYVAAEFASRAMAFRQRVINGTFMINQRKTFVSSVNPTTFSAGTYIFDRWKAGSDGVSITFRNPNLTVWEGLVTISAGSLVQWIDAPTILDGPTFVLSWTGDAVGRAYQANANPKPAFARSPVTVSYSTAGSYSLAVEFSSGTVGRVQLEPGTVPTVFERRDDELRRCQYYCAALTDLMNTGGLAASASQIQARFTLPVAMRASPTMILLPGSWAVSDDGGNDTVASSASLVATSMGPRGGRVTLGGFSGLTAGKFYGSPSSGAAATLIATAEL